MNKKLFIMIGRSGSGKGTQAELLQKKVETDFGVNIKHISTGDGFREFMKGDSFISTLSRHADETGRLQPEFLAIWNWSDIFINTVQEEDSVILDGAPRKLFEVNVLHNALSFIGYEELYVIYVDVSENWSKERLAGRGRKDDIGAESVAKRMEWFETDVIPVVESYKNDSRYKFLQINGEQTIEDVHKEIVSKLDIFN